MVIKSVYVIELFNTGDHVPRIPLLEVVGSGLKIVPAQTGAIGVNVGVTFGFTMIENEYVDAHCPGLGVTMMVVWYRTNSANLQETMLSRVETTAGIYPAPWLIGHETYPTRVS